MRPHAPLNGAMLPLRQTPQVGQLQEVRMEVMQVKDADQQEGCGDEDSGEERWHGELLQAEVLQPAGRGQQGERSLWKPGWESLFCLSCAERGETHQLLSQISQHDSAALCIKLTASLILWFSMFMEMTYFMMHYSVLCNHYIFFVELMFVIQKLFSSLYEPKTLLQSLFYKKLKY